MNIAVLCEALIDFKATGPLAFQGFPGGSPLNVGIACARLGQPSGFVGQLSSDLFGDALLAHLHHSGLDTSFVTRSSAPSTLGFVDTSGQHPRYAFVRHGAADTLYAPDPLPELPLDLRFLHFGSISLLSDPTRSSVERLVVAHRERATVVFDPNVRPSLIPEHAGYQRRCEGWVSLSHLVKLSEEDAAWLYPGDPLERVAHTFLGLGARAVVVTRGERGAQLYLGSGGMLEVPAPPTEVLDTVGAGDTFTAGLMVALLEGGFTEHAELSRMSLERWAAVLGFAVRAAALNCTRAGCDPPTRAEVGSFPP